MSPKGTHGNKAHRAVQQVSAASVASALAAIFLTIGYYVQVLEFFWFFMASLCMMIIIIRCTIRAALMAFAASVLLTLLLCSFNFLFILPFVVFMGPHPIADAVMKKYSLTAIIGHAIKAVWFCAFVFAMIRFTNLFLFIDLGASQLMIPLIIGICAPVYLLYDFAVRAVMRRLARHLLHLPSIPRI